MGRITELLVEIVVQTNNHKDFEMARAGWQQLSFIIFHWGYIEEEDVCV